MCPLATLPALGAVALTWVLLAVYRCTKKSRLPLPPGPKGLPLVGNALGLPRENEWVFYSDLHSKHGDLVHVSVLGKPYLVIGSLKVASELLEKRSAVYSGRMTVSLGGALDGWKRSMLFQEGSDHRGYRRFANKGLSAVGVEQYQELQEREAVRTLRRLLDQPDKFLEHYKENAAAVIMMVAYGHSVKDRNDPFVSTVTAVMDEFSTLFTPASLLLDYIPFIKHIPEWMPGMGFKKVVRLWKIQADKTFDEPFAATKARMEVGTAVPCLTTQLLQDKKSNEDERHIMGVAGSLFQAGADTSASALCAFTLAMVLYPEVQEKAREEIDRVVGSDRLPQLPDKERLPYVTALIKEVLRWLPIAPMGFPHRATEEDVYGGYRIPKDSLVIVNIWNMAQDNSVYGDDPNVFRPERFLGADPAPRGYRTAQTQEFGSPVFGFGRRLCPGQHLAMATLFILCSNILATMKISPAIGEDGMLIIPPVESSGGVIVYPKPFRCHIEPRSDRAVGLIREGI